MYLSVSLANWECTGISLALLLSGTHAERQSARMSKITNDDRLNPVWHGMLYSCAHMTTVGVKGYELVIDRAALPRCLG